MTNFSPRETEYLKRIIRRPGMYFSEEDFVHALGFISGSICAFSFDDSKHDEEIQSWLVKKYFDRSFSAIAWPGLIEKLPMCSGHCGRENVRNFLQILGDFLEEAVDAGHHASGDDRCRS